MNKYKFPRPFTSIFLGLAGVMASAAVFANPTLEYKIDLAEDGETYEVWMLPSVTPEPDISLTGQVTLRVPTGVAFQAEDVVASVKGGDWIEASRVDAPEEAPDFDYISFSFVGLQGDSAHNYNWQADQEKLVFSFKNRGGCVDGVSIMANDDPFNVEANSANTNPGNQFTNLGWGSVGENNFKGVYGEPISCSQ